MPLVVVLVLDWVSEFELEELVSLLESVDRICEHPLIPARPMATAIANIDLLFMSHLSVASLTRRLMRYRPPFLQKT